MIPTGIILAVLDCDLDAVVAWNRWYDLEHVPPNVRLPGVMSGRRYVAPPELHDLRVTAPTSPLAGRRGSFLTIYTLGAEPAETLAGMSTLRDRLYAEDRMRFPAEKKAVRDGDAMALLGAVSSPAIRLPEEEVPFVGHTGLLLVQRRGPPPVGEWYRSEWSPAVAAVDGVHGVMTFQSSRDPTARTDLVLFEGDAAGLTGAVRAAAPHHPDADVTAEAPYLLIEPLSYPWAGAMQGSDLPATIG
ncbi:MAG TPA: hypothetical protein VFW24_15970 [Acidimicrobiales bacterium]|nr:hypothetical protein [Acidimicrobiales bacterium]